MILELADIRIHPGQNAAFEEAIQRGIITVAARAKGFQGYMVNRGIESPERNILQFFWDTLEDRGFPARTTFPSGVPSSAPSSPRRPL
jgi:heme-degrading monooxygenase HmoA